MSRPGELDPGLSASQLQRLAFVDAAARPLIAGHPQAYPALLEWLGTLGDPEVDRALAERATALVGPSTAARRRRPRLLVAALVAGALVVGGGVAAALVFTDLLRRESRAEPGTAAGPDASEELPVAPGEDEMPGVGSSAPARPTFADGARIAWELQAGELVSPPHGHTADFVQSSVFIAFHGVPDLGGDLPAELVVAAIDFVDSAGAGAGGVTFGLDSTTGEVRWELDRVLYGCQSVPGGSELVCASDLGASEYESVVVDSATGRVRTVIPAWGLTAVWDETIINTDFMTEPAVVTAHDLDGNELWRTSVETMLSEIAFTEVDSGLVHVSSGSSSVLDAATGELLLAAELSNVTLTGGGVVVQPWERDGIVFQHPDLSVSEVRAGSDRFWRLLESEDGGHWVLHDPWETSGGDPTTGEQSWQVDGNHHSTGSAARDGEERIVLVSTDPIGLTLVDPSQTVPPATVPLHIDTSGAGISHHTEVIDDVVLVHEPGRTRAYDAISGGYLWSLDTGILAPTSEQPRSDGRLLVVDEMREDPQGDSRMAMMVPAHADHVVTTGLDVQLPADVPACPGTTVLLAWAELEDGWIIVCGYSLGKPTYWAMSTSSGGLVEAPNVSYDHGAGQYTARFTDGATGWLDHTPGVAGFRTAQGETARQAPVVRVIFVELGESDLDSGVGDYGVEAPDHTAADQVRYFAEILDRSAQARSSLGDAVTAVRKCEDGLDGAVATIASVRDNRAELLGAIRAAPVDLVPQGTLLVDELAYALEASYHADIAFLRWAEDNRELGCGAGDASPGEELSQAAGEHKEAFAERWNSVIVPGFDVDPVSRETL